MTTITFAPMTAGTLLHRVRAASPLLFNASLAFLAGFVICMGLQLADHRQLYGVSVWIKPAKFFLSVALQMLTLAWAISLLPESRQRARKITFPAAYFVAAGTFELAYIAYRAGLGEASHFNTGTPMASLLYSLMGTAAIGMMLATGWIGLRIRRDSPRSALTAATGWGFLLAMLATIIVGMTLGGMQSHWIGGDQTDATGLPILGWSTTGGDLRPSHFLALHLSQALPLAAWLGGGRLALGAAILLTLAAAATYVQALGGLPLIPS